MTRTPTIPKPRWSRRLPHSVMPLDGEPIKTLRDGVLYMDKIGAGRQAARAWHHLAELLLDAAENNGAIYAVHRQLRLALLLDGKLDVRRTPPL